MEVEIQTSGNPLAPDTQAIAGPDRIVVDFPGALPAAELHALEVNRGALKRIRAGLFFNDPPITRIVLDLAEPQSYRISTMPNAVVIKLGEANGGNQSQVSLNPVTQRPCRRSIPNRLRSACTGRKTSEYFAACGHEGYDRPSFSRGYAYSGFSDGFSGDDRCDSCRC